MTPVEPNEQGIASHGAAPSRNADDNRRVDDGQDFNPQSGRTKKVFVAIVVALLSLTLVIALFATLSRGFGNIAKRAAKSLSSGFSDPAEALGDNAPQDKPEDKEKPSPPAIPGL